MKRLLCFGMIIALILFVFVSCGEEEEDDGNVSIKGKVTDEAGNPVAEANVKIHLTEDQSITSNSDGEFHFSNLAAGNYQLTVSASGYRTYVDTITVWPGKVTHADVVLKRGDTPSIAGFVLDEKTGDAIQNATVQTTPVTDSPITDASGRYEFGKLEPGTYTVRVFANGYAVSATTVVVERDKTARADFQLTKQAVELSVTPSSLDFGADSSSKILTIENLGSGTLTWNITFPSEGWLTVVPTEGNTKNIPSTVNVTVNRQGFAAGKYDLIMLITSNGGTKQIPVAMKVE